MLKSGASTALLKIFPYVGDESVYACNISLQYYYKRKLLLTL